MKVAVLSTSLGSFDQHVKHTSQTVKADYFTFTDDNYPPRKNSMSPRLQAKIPKMFGWQMKPGYDFYVWLDGNLSLKSPDGVKYLMDKDYDVVVLKHPDRDTVWWEYRYNWRGLNNNAPSNYLTERYTGEWLDEQIKVIKDDKDYVDDYMVNGGVFMYRNTPKVHEMLKEWFYHVSRYCISDQMSWAYVLKKSGLRVKILPDDYRDCDWLKVERHKKHG